MQAIPPEATMTVLSATILLLLVMDPLGNIPFFLAALRSVDSSRHRAVIARELLVALGVMICFLFAGPHVLRLLNSSEPALTAAGGIILFLIALRMIFPIGEQTPQPAEEDEPFIVPLAIPYVAGPAVLSTELLFVSREPERWSEWLVAVLAAWFVSGVILYFASGLRYYLGRKGLLALERLMGMLLVTQAVQMLMNGIGRFITTVQHQG
jgi:multiple antibiotic resistance protein